MQIQERKVNDVTILAINGDIDLNSSPNMRKKFEELIKNNALKIIINFQDVSYIDSSGLATIIEMLQRLKKVQGHLHLSNMSEKIKNLFEITKIDKLFQMYPNEQEALKDF
jgi:anti-sigma B factor antagonist